jgi:hypothetical protein
VIIWRQNENTRSRKAEREKMSKYKMNDIPKATKGKYQKYLMCNLGYEQPRFGHKSLVLVAIERVNGSVAWCECAHCGKPIGKTMYVCNEEETDVEYIFGETCFGKHVVQAGLI